MTLRTMYNGQKIREGFNKEAIGSVTGVRKSCRCPGMVVVVVVVVVGDGGE